MRRNNTILGKWDSYPKEDNMKKKQYGVSVKIDEDIYKLLKNYCREHGYKLVAIMNKAVSEEIRKNG